VEREPIVTAKAVASLDVVSGGRFLFGVGAGWIQSEMRSLGIDPARRWDILRERILAMKQIWTQDEAEYQGTYVNLPGIRSWPKPVRVPYPPVLLGVQGKAAAEYLIDYADEWLPLDDEDAAPWKPRIAELRRQADERGRGAIPISVCSGRRPEAAVLEDYQALGVRRVIFLIPSAGPEEVSPLLDDFAKVAARYT
jgi:alkanesulfonate monooxygenase SsuD/methylene tetrahydromethanopterin reductase-like flavin-dependent oxidoreductase (luciferase family)